MKTQRPYATKKRYSIGIPVPENIRPEGARKKLKFVFRKTQAKVVLFIPKAANIIEEYKQHK